MSDRRRSPRQPEPPSQRRRLPVPGLGPRQPVAPVRRRRVSRAERDARRQRQITLLISLAGALCLVIIAIFAVDEYWAKPRTVLATVDGTEIRRRDYWKVRINDLINQRNEYNNLYNLYQQFQPDQASQYLQAAAVAEQQIGDVWGSTDVDDDSLNKMIEDQVYLKNLDDLGLEVTGDDVDAWILDQFDPAEAPLVAPTATPTLIPTRAAWATETAAANETATASASAAAATEAPPVDPTPTAPGPAAAPTSAGLPAPPLARDAAGASTSAGIAPTTAGAAPTSAAPPAPPLAPTSPPEADSAGTPVGGSPAASPEASPVESPTPNPEQARSTAEVGYEQFREDVFETAHMDRGDYERLVARPGAARQKVDAAIAAGIGQSAEQVRAAHILVETKELADSLKVQLDGGADFAQLAREQSTDTTTAANGGDLGWFPRGVMVRPFDEVAFSLEAGAVSAPVSTEFGWHLIRVGERAPDRPLTDDQITQLQTSLVERWVDDRRAEADIEAELEPTPTTVAEFQAPPGAPTVAPTPDPADPAASPAASPVADAPADGGFGTPEAAPLDGTPVASPPA